MGVLDDNIPVVRLGREAAGDARRMDVAVAVRQLDIPGAIGNIDAAVAAFDLNVPAEPFDDSAAVAAVDLGVATEVGDLSAAVSQLELERCLPRGPHLIVDLHA